MGYTTLKPTSITPKAHELAKEDAKADREKIIKQIGSRLADTEISEHPVT